MSDLILDIKNITKSFPKVKTVIAGLGDNSGTVGAAIAAREGCKSI